MNQLPPFLTLVRQPTPLEEMKNLRLSLGGSHPRLFVKRDDVIPFGFGGNKVRKLQFEAAAALKASARTLVTVGGIQSNHARATAAVAAHVGMQCVIIANGTKPERATANALLDELLGAEVEYIPSRAEREAASTAVMERLAQAGRAPYFVPLGASTPLGALGYVQAIGEMIQQGLKPDVIVHAASSAGTQAGLVAGCALHGLGTQVIGVSADDPARELSARVRDIVAGVGKLLGENLGAPGFMVSDEFVGQGYGIPTDLSRAAQRAAARTEGFFVDNTYSAKALAAMLSWVTAGRWSEEQTILFWHTGGQVGLFA
ncbi:MAG TPA: pyridoxal-phosphate dependent enzyme [Gemmatimonadaceae bacterium]|nr:pyridoxal-phosphate dependent enzyme [Gemmatimonadaceae bacterium]